MTTLATIGLAVVILGAAVTVALILAAGRADEEANEAWREEQRRMKEAGLR